MTEGMTNFLADRLRQARLDSEITQAELADKIGRSRTMIGYYERGNHAPSKATLEDIADVLEFPMHFFTTECRERIAADTPVFWRSYKSSTKRAKERQVTRLNWVCDILSFLLQYVELPAPNLPDFNIKKPLSLSMDDVEELADRTREYWGLGEGPISNVVWLLENHGILVVREHFFNDKLDGFTTWLRNPFRPLIVLNADKRSTARSRLDAAHELGHLILHRNLAKKDVQNQHYHSLLEQQAFRFRGAFLFPENSFGREVAAPKLSQFRALKRRWKVAIAMMIQRAKALKWISEDDVRRLYINMSRRGWRRREPLDDELEEEKPQLLSEAIQILVSECVISREGLCDALPYGPQRLESLAGLPVGYLTNDNWGRVRRLTLHKDQRKQRPDNQSSEDADIVEFPK